MKHILSLVDMIKKATGKSAKYLNGFDRQMLLRQEYEKTFGIYDHDNRTSDPPGYELILMNPSEDLDEHSKLYNTIRRYHINQIYKEFGLSLTDFLELPFDIVDFLYKVLSESRERAARAAEDIKDKVDKDMTGLL